MMQLHRMADKAFPALRRLFTDAWEAMREALPWAAVGEALQRGDLPAVLVMAEEAWMASTDRMVRDPLRAIMQQIVGQSAEASQPALTTLLKPRVAITFDAASPHVLAYVQQHSAQLIRGIGLETRQAIRALLVQNMQAGRSWQSVVPDIREMIGVTVRQADALVARRALLLAQGMKEARVEKLIAQKTRAYIRLRARTMARHESLLAANAGQFSTDTTTWGHGVMTTKYALSVNTPMNGCVANCRDTRDMNAEGVGLLEPFQDAKWGPICDRPSIFFAGAPR